MLGSLAPRLAMVPDGAPPYDGEARREPEPAPARPVPPVPVAAEPGSAGAVARQFAQAITETVAGRRPFRQVIGSTTERVQDQIQQLIPLLRTDSGPKIRRILTSRPDSDVVEVTVIAAFGARTRALAMRFEHLAARPSAPGLPPRPARWLCTDIESG
jgi:hypothetical protein